MDAGFHDAGQRHPWAAERLNREIARELRALEACNAGRLRHASDTTHWLARLERRRELTAAANALAEAAAYGVLDHPLRGNELLCEIATDLGAHYLAALAPPDSSPEAGS